MAEQFEEKKDNISEEEIKDTASTNEDNNGTVNQDEQTEEAVETVENKDTAEASDTASDSSSDDEGKKKGFFGKEKKDKKDKKDQKIDELTDQYRRTLAEFDNYRKRTDKEKSAMYEIGAKDVIEKILPVIDNFERAISLDDDNLTDELSKFLSGFKMIYTSLLSTLNAIGVKEIEAMGKQFDPKTMEAIMTTSIMEEEEGVVVEVMQKGYTYNDKVIRVAMVKVNE